MFLFVCSTHCWVRILHGSDEGHGLRGAGPNRLGPTISEHTGHRGLIGQAEDTLVLESTWIENIWRHGIEEEFNCVGWREEDGSRTLNWASCRASWMKASGLVLHFLMSPLPNSVKRQPWKSTSSAMLLAILYELSMASWH